MSRDGFLQWTQWWRLLIEEDHEAQAVELFMSFYDSEQAELLGWLAGRSRHTREKIKDLTQELIQLQAEMIQLEAESTRDRATIQSQKNIIEDLLHRVAG